MKNIFLSFDIETIVSPRSKNLDYRTTVTLGALKIAQMLADRNLKGTFFISLSPKDPSVDVGEYLREIRYLILALKQFPNIDIQPHLHALGLPVSFECNSDHFSDYSHEQQVEMLVWAKQFFEELGVQVTGFRPGGFRSGTSYYKALNEAGYRFSSIVMNDCDADIDLVENKQNKLLQVHRFGEILEHRVTTVLVNSIKPGVVEKINLSPDFFRLSSVQRSFDELDSLNVNFHSFSMFSNRLARENHHKQLRNNIIYYFCEKPLIRLVKLFGLESYSTETIFSKELEDWLEEFKHEKYQTLWYKEISADEE